MPNGCDTLLQQLANHARFAFLLWKEKASNQAEAFGSLDRRC